MDNNTQNACGRFWQDKGKLIVIILGMLLLAGIITTAILRDRWVNQQFSQITVTGQGRVAYSPDIAIINLGVQIDKTKTAEEALNQLNAKMKSITAAVKAAGVADADIETENYNLAPQISYGNNNVSTTIGYTANQQLTIKVRDFDVHPEKLNQVIAATSKAGVNQVNSLTFDSSKINDLKQQARLLAIKDARERSAALADAAGVKIKNVASWYENLIQPLPVYGVSTGGGMGGAGGASSPQVSSGNHEVIIEIGINYNIKQ